MKKLVIGLAVGSLLVIGFIVWHETVPGFRSMSVSTSQIYIHGTPVCVINRGDATVARIGECEAFGSPPDGGSAGNAPFYGDPGGTGQLPPGHPPIPDGMLPNGERRIPI